MEGRTLGSQSNPQSKSSGAIPRVISCKPKPPDTITLTVACSSPQASSIHSSHASTSLRKVPILSLHHGEGQLRCLPKEQEIKVAVRDTFIKQKLCPCLSPSTWHFLSIRDQVAPPEGRAGRAWLLNASEPAKTLTQSGGKLQKFQKRKQRVHRLLWEWWLGLWKSISGQAEPQSLVISGPSSKKK